MSQIEMMGVADDTKYGEEDKVGVHDTVVPAAFSTEYRVHR